MKDKNIIKITTFSQLSSFLPPTMVSRITQSAPIDSDWLYDILDEYITSRRKPGQPFYIEEFHGALTRNNIRPQDIDLESVFLSFLNAYDQKGAKSYKKILLDSKNKLR